MAGKTVSIILRDNLGTAVYNAGTQKIEFPSSIPISRFPKQGIKKKALLASWKGLPSCEDRSESSVSVKVLLACRIGSHSQAPTAMLGGELSSSDHDVTISGDEI